MNRRDVLTRAALTAAGALGCAAAAGAEQAGAAPIPHAVAIELGKRLTIAARSNPLRILNRDFYILSIGSGVVKLDKDSRLTATLKAGVLQHVVVDYWISAAVFDAHGVLLGAASHKQSVERMRLGATPTLFIDIDLDFGISNAFKKAAYLVVSIGDRDLPPTD